MDVNATALRAPAPPGLLPRRLLDDERLGRLAAEGDAAAFATIFERFHQELYRYCRAIVSDHEEAQDALQSTMAAALRALPGEERRIALRPWLYRIAHNEAISIIRRRSEPAPAFDENAPEDRWPGTGGAAAQAASSADAGAEQRERLRELVADLWALPERQRGALVMRELSGLGYAEIASALGCGEPAARQTVYEAREALRESKRGREMDCPAVREAISEREGRRILRGRALRAHLRGCEGCQDFRAAIAQRGADLQLLSPPLSAFAASSVLGAVIGHGTGEGGAAATLGAGTGGAGAAATAAGAGGAAALTKGGAVLAALVVGAAAAGATGALDLPLIGALDDGGASLGAEESARGAESGRATGERSSPDSVNALTGERGGPGRESHPGRGGSQRSDGATPGSQGQAGEHGNASPSPGAGPSHSLPPSSQGSSPQSNALGSPHVSPGSAATPPSQRSATQSKADAGVPPAPSNVGGKAPVPADTP